MKKLAIIAIITLVSFGLIVPVMAADLDVSGHFRTRGFYLSNANSNLVKESASDAYYDFRFRPELTIKVNENIKLNSRVAIFDEKFGTGSGGRYVNDTNTTASPSKSDVATWDRAWATIITPYGKLDIGRMSGGLFGLSLFETEYARDRIKWTMPVGDLTVLGIIEKNSETETDTNATLSDMDSSAYYLAGVYKKDNVEAGLLYGLAHAENETTKTMYHVIDPYFNMTVGNFSVKGEIQYKTGTLSEPKNGTDSTDIAAMGIYLAAAANFGAVNAEIGYASAAGDDDPLDNEISSLGGAGAFRSGLGDEWVPLVVLQDINALLDQGNDSATKTSTGVNLIYVQADFAVNEDVKLTAVIGNATPNVKGGANKSDEAFGNEIDLKLEWKIADAVTYSANFGYLMAGDFFKTGTDDPEDTHTFYHCVQVDF